MSELESWDVTSRPMVRADLLTPEVTVIDGQPVSVQVSIRNTSAVIDHLTIHVLGMIPESIAQTPSELSLFPEESVEVTLDLGFQEHLPAGAHEVLLVVEGSSGQLAPAELELTVISPETSSMRLSVEPPIRTGGRRGTFEVELTNDGNTPIDAMLRATDADRVLDLQFSQRRLGLRVGQHGYTNLVGRAKRPWTGAPVEHLITITSEAGELTETAEARFRQKARLTPGVILLLTLGFIVLLWALAMLFGVQAALSPPEPTKTIPDGFTEGIGRDDLDPALVGGTVAGEVTAASTGQPLDRVTVEVFDARGEIVTATATDDDGSYELAGLVPGRYRVRLVGDGFEERWWPDASDAADATQLVARARDSLEDVDTSLAGQPGSIGGEAAAGDGNPTTTTVEVVPVDLLEEEAPRIADADEDGIWSISGLTAPATYRITYRAPGFDDVQLTEELPAGGQVVVNTTRLPAAPGELRGEVVDGDGQPLGGVEVVAQRGETQMATTTPTSGDVGAFVFEDLETPGTYLLTFIAEGYASETQGVQLGAGESVDGLTVTLSEAAGTVTGLVTGADGQPLGGAEVVVTGGGVEESTETLTSGEVGRFRVSGLPLPGTYTVTVQGEGTSRETTEVTLDRDAPSGTANLALGSSVGRIEGRVVDAGSGQPISGVELQISDGEVMRDTTSASAPSGSIGRFNVGGLPPGTYTITATRPDGGTTTVLRSVGGGETVTIEIAAGPP